MAQPGGSCSLLRLCSKWTTSPPLAAAAGPDDADGFGNLVVGKSDRPEHQALCVGPRHQRRGPDGASAEESITMTAGEDAVLMLSRRPACPTRRFRAICAPSTSCSHAHTCDTGLLVPGRSILCGNGLPAMSYSWYSLWLTLSAKIRRIRCPFKCRGCVKVVKKAMLGVFMRHRIAGTRSLHSLWEWAPSYVILLV